MRAGVGEWVKTANGKPRAESWSAFHTFRATLAIREQGWSLEQVRVFLGYSSRMTTDRYYAHPVSSPGGPTRNKLKNEGLRCSVLAP